MRMILKAAGALLLALIPAYAGWLFTRSAPDVRYTLLEKIPLSAGTDQGPVETAQQLQVRNAGNAKATRVVVHVKTQATLDNITKYADSDQFRVSASASSFQLEYPELPPESGFSLVLRSPGRGIDTADLEVSHSDGKATEALAGKQSSTRNTLLGLATAAFTLLYFALIVRDAKRIYKDSLASKIRHGSLREELSKPKPWLLSEAEWNSLLTSASKRRLTESYLIGSDVRKAVEFEILNLEKPTGMSGDAWDELTTAAADKLTKTYESSARTRFGSIEDLLGTEKPKLFPASKWSTLRDSAAEHYLENLRSRLYNSKAIAALLSYQRPPEIPEGPWQTHVERLEEQFHAACTSEALAGFNAARSLMKVPKPLEMSEQSWARLQARLRQIYFAALSDELHESDAPASRW